MKRRERGAVNEGWEDEQRHTGTTDEETQERGGEVYVGEGVGRYEDAYEVMA